MPTFDVSALPMGGNAIVTESVEATDRASARSALEARGLTVLEVVEAKTRGGWSSDIRIAKRVKHNDLVMVTRMFATMIKSGMSILKALGLLARQAKNPVLADALRSSVTFVENGGKVADAFAEHPKIFPPVMISMIRAGESAGYLKDALGAVADSVERDAELRANIKKAATYPVVVLFVAILASIGMLTFIVPIFAEMYADADAELPGVTQFSMYLSDQMKWAVPAMVVVAAIFTWWWKKYRRTLSVRRALEPLFLRVPVLGDLARQIAVTRMARNLGVMLDQGVHMLNAIQVSATTAGNIAVEDALMAAGEQVRAGANLATHLGEGGVIPELVVEMVRSGEESGETSEMLLSVADFYDREVSTRTSQLSAIVEPILIVGIGAIVGFLLLSMYMPMFSIFEAIK